MYNLYNKDLNEIKEFMLDKFNIIKNNKDIKCNSLDDEQLDIMVDVFIAMGKECDELKKNEVATTKDKINLQMALDSFATGFGGI